MNDATIINQIISIVHRNNYTDIIINHNDNFTNLENTNILHDINNNINSENNNITYSITLRFIQNIFRYYNARGINELDNFLNNTDSNNYLQTYENNVLNRNIIISNSAIRNMDENNARVSNIINNEGWNRGIQAMFQDENTGNQLSYSEMRARFG